MEHVQSFWRMVAPSRRLIICALYRTALGLELRAGEGEADRWLSVRVDTQRTGENWASIWKAAAESQGFTEFSH